MFIKALIGEFEHEVASTRKLLQAIPQKDLHYRPSPISWTMGELAQHIATVYYWYPGTLNQDVYDLSTDPLERGDPHQVESILQLFEANVVKARQALSSLREDQLLTPWTMKAGGHTVLGPLPRATVARSFLFNHLYHHRGELVVYLRATGNKVPGMYGPTYEESQAQKG